MITWTPEKEETLEEAIAHWERLRDGKPINGEGVDSRYCCLCALYMHVTEDNQRCGGCPVRERTGLEYCAGSPWIFASKLWNWRLNDAQSPEFMAAAGRMVDFLKSLRKGDPRWASRLI